MISTNIKTGIVNKKIVEREFKIGNRVIRKMSNGVVLSGVIDIINCGESLEYPIHVTYDFDFDYNNMEDWFTLDGRWYITGDVCLFHLDEIEEKEEQSENIHYTRESVLDLINEWRSISGENTILTSAKFKQWAFKNNLR